MTKGQEKSDDRVVPEGGRKPVPSAPEERGGKAVTASKAVGQLRMFGGTADSPRGGETKRKVGRPTGCDGLLPKPRTKMGWSSPAMTMEEIANVENLRRAFWQVASNKGAPGPDGQSIEEVLGHLASILPTLNIALLRGSYRPGKIRRVWIPKAGGGKRGLGIPNVVDRIVQQAVHRVLSPHFEKIFHAASHGFRPGRSCHTAIAEAAEHVEAGFAVVVDLDLEKFFDRVHHDRLLARLEDKGIADRRVLQLIRRMLQAEVVMPDGVVVSTEEGTPQGGPLSPLLSNVVLDELDWELQQRGHRFVRYADDCNVYVRSLRAGERVMASLERFINGRMRLAVNRDKSAVGRPEDRHFVGFSVHGARGPRLSVRSARRIRRRIVELTPRNWGGSLQSCVARLNRYLLGWIGFFGVVGRDEARTLANCDAHIRRRLRAIVLRQRKRKRYILRWLQTRRVPLWKARRDVYGRHRSLWALSWTRSAHQAMSTHWFDSQGLLQLGRLWRTHAARQPTVRAPTQLLLDLG